MTESLIPDAELREMGRSPNDFDCIPKSMQVSMLAEKLIARGHTRFTATDISNIFKQANMNSPRSDRKIRCSAKQADEYLMKAINRNEIRLTRTADGVFRTMD